MSLQKRLDRIEARSKPKGGHKRVLMMFDDETEAQARVRESVGLTEPIQIIHFETCTKDDVDAANVRRLRDISFKGTRPVK